MLDVTTLDEDFQPLPPGSDLGIPLGLPEPIRQVLDALPAASPTAPGITADVVAFHLDQSIELVREALWALRDQGLAQLHCGDDARARWSRA